MAVIDQHGADHAAKKHPSKLHFFTCDVSDDKAMQKCMQEISKSLGNIDFLVADAGVCKTGSLEGFTMSDLERVIDVDYKGVFVTLKSAVPYLVKPGASIVLISSITAHACLPYSSVYASAKAAVSQMAKVLAYELGEEGVRVNAISPGFILTPMIEGLPKKHGDPHYFDKLANLNPVKRNGAPEDIANACLFLCSDKSSFITGVDLLVDGGYSKLPQNPIFFKDANG